MPITPDREIPFVRTTPEQADVDPDVSGAGSCDDDGALHDLEHKLANRQILGRFERRYMTRVLERTGRNVRAASRESRLERNRLIELLRRHGLRDGNG